MIWLYGGRRCVNDKVESKERVLFGGVVGEMCREERLMEVWFRL